MSNRITHQIYLENMQDYNKFLEVVNTRRKILCDKSFPIFVHCWDDNSWTLGSVDFEIYYPSLKKVSLETFLSPLYQTLNGD